MRLNQGIQKYREGTKRAGKTSEDKTEKPNGAAKADPVKSVDTEADAKKRRTGASAFDEAAAKTEASKTEAAKKAPARGSAVAAAAVRAAKVEVKATVTAEVEIEVEVEKEVEKEAESQQIAEEVARESAETEQLVKGDFSPVNSSQDKLVLEYAPLIKYIAQKIAARLPANIELDDLISSGVIGLMDAIEKYDASRDNKFKTYAEFRIRGAILDELRAQDWVPRSVREKAKILERCYAKIEQEKGGQATDEEICKELGINQEEFHEMLNQVRSVSLLSYDDLSSFSKADKRALHGYGESGSKAPTPFSEVNTGSIKKLIAKAIQDLPEKQRLVLSLYYYEDLNLKEIGKVLDVTESRVSQLHTQAILRLKAKLGAHWDEVVSLLG